MRTVQWLFLFATLLSFAMAPRSGAQGGSSAAKQYLVYVGTYTTKQSSKGIYAYRFDAATGKLTEVGLAAESVDPSFLAIHPSGKYLYAVNEVGDFAGQKSGAVSAFSIDRATGTLKLLNQVASGGAGPCHISLDKAGKFALVANYDGGSVATFPIKEDGSLAAAAGFVQHSGSSVNKERQEGPHAHWIETSPDNRFALAADLGLDEILIYRFDSNKGTLTPNAPPFVKVSPGAGPRHFAFHPNGKFGYVLSEMAATVTAFSYDSKRGALTTLQTVTTLPEHYNGPTEAAELVAHPSGKFIYASNRAGLDTITEFASDSRKGTLKLVDKFSTGGKTPRNFVIDPTGSFLLAANQESGSIVIFRIDPATGTLSPTGQEVQVPTPVCIVFMLAESEEGGQPSVACVDSPVLGSDIPICRAGVHGVSIPSCISCPNPVYTDKARKAKYQGTVSLRAVVTAEGRVTNIVVMKGPGNGLEQKAVEAVSKWQLKPAMGPNGRPVAVIVPIEVTFRLY